MPVKMNPIEPAAGDAILVGDPRRAFALAQEKGLMNRLLTPHQATIGLIGQVDGLLFNWTKNPDMFPLASYAPCILDAWFRGLTAPVDAA